MDKQKQLTTIENMKRGGSDRNIIVVKDFLTPSEVDRIRTVLTEDDWQPGTPTSYANPDPIADFIELESVITAIENIASYQFGANIQRYDDTGRFNRWEIGDLLERHSDSAASPRDGSIDVSQFLGSGIAAPPPVIMYSSVVYLNDDYEGGELWFPKQDYKTKPAPGTLILFPATIMYPHEVAEITSGNKYTYSLFLSDATIIEVFLQVFKLAESVNGENK
jgi:predicted 2-oxoglutarate/Fe(II)-dependent dioxygenase YbiX